MGLIVGGHGDGHVKAIGISGLRQQLLALGRIVGVVFRQLRQEILGQLGIDAAAHGGAVTVRHDVHDLLPVDGVAHGLPHLLVVEGLRGVVEIHRLHQIHGALQHGQIAAQLRRLRAGQVSAQIHAAALQGHHQRGGILIDLIRHFAESGGSAPVIVKALQHDVLLRRAGRQLEGARAGDKARLRIAVLGNDGRRQEIDQLQIGLLQPEGHRPFVHGFQVLNSRKRRHQGRVPRVVGAAVHGIDHILRRHRLAVMELHALTQGEGVDKSVLRDIVAFSHSGDQFTIGAGFHQALINVE